MVNSKRGRVELKSEVLMDLKVPTSNLCLHKETRVSLEPLCPNATIQIQIPSTTSFGRSSPPKRRTINGAPRHGSEGSFKQSCLSRNGSIYFRKSKKHPRSILFRTLDDAVLELRSVDLSRSNREEKEAVLTIQLRFPDVIRPGCVALADPVEGDLLDVFVLTKENELYTLTLRPDFFCRPEAWEGDTARWCQVFKPATLHISTPHRLVACSSLRLLVGLGDGRLMHLIRRQGDDGSGWHEATLNDGAWGSSLRGLIRWQGGNTVRYDGTSLDQGTSVAIAQSPDGKHAYTVCLNHTLKIWNLETGRVCYTKDLLKRKREPQEIVKVMLDPGVSGLLQVYRLHSAIEGDEYYFTTFSPQDSGIFKFWAVRDADEGGRGIRDLFPEATLKLPDPDPGPSSNAIWTMADFKISHRLGEGLEMWVLMRSNRRYKLYNLKFDLLDLPDVWLHHWSTTAFETLDEQSPPQAPDPDTASNSWLDFLLYPGRYSEATLETALAMQHVGRTATAEISTNYNASLKERISTAIASQVQLYRLDDGKMAFVRYRNAVCQAWNAYWQDVRGLHRHRWDISSLVFDEDANLPWVIFADGCSVIRECNRAELLAQNGSKDLAKSMNLLEAPTIELEAGHEDPQLADELAILLEAANAFRQSFSRSIQRGFEHALTTELQQDPSSATSIRIQAFYNRSNFGTDITDAQFNDLLSALEPLGGLEALTTDTLGSVIQTLLPPTMSTEASGLQSTKFGLRVLVRGAQEMIHLHQSMLYALLALVVFMEVDIDHEEMTMENFDAAQLFNHVVDLLKQYQMLDWLARNVRLERENLPEEHDSVQGIKGPDLRVSTVFENLFAADPSPQSCHAQTQSAAITHGIEDIIKWVLGGNDQLVPLDDVLVHIQCDLLAQGNIDLATDFLRYQPSTAWSTYIKGRLYFSLGEYTEASMYFQKAAFNLSRPTTTLDYVAASRSLLSPIEAAHFSQGLPNYYLHIIHLFTPHSPSQVAHFTHLALQLTSPSSNAALHATLLTHLFHSSLSTSNFPSAYSALTRYTEAPLQRTHLSLLFTSIITAAQTSLLLSLPSPTLHSIIDSLLAEKASKQLDTQSKPSYHKLLASFRIARNDFRGAASTLLERLVRVKNSGGGEGVKEEYLAVMNLLACVGEEEGWVFGEGEGKRRVVRLGEVRRGYQDLLDREAAIEGGRFALVGGADEMDLL